MSIRTDYRHAPDRETALATGNPRYQGEPCKRGHEGIRNTKWQYCMACSQENTRHHMCKKAPSRMLDIDHLKPEPTFDEDYYGELV